MSWKVKKPVKKRTSDRAVHLLIRSLIWTTAFAIPSAAAAAAAAAAAVILFFCK